VTACSVLLSVCNRALRKAKEKRSQLKKLVKTRHDQRVKLFTLRHV